MTRAWTCATVAIACTAGLALRLASLDARPMHHDEANQAVKVGALLERGEYRYDAREHHGPTLYYLALPVAALRGQATLASLDERTLRIVPAIFGAGTVLLVTMLSAGMSRAAVAASAWLMALSPAMVFYSRMFIHEALFAFFVLAFVIALGRCATGRRIPWAAAAGVAAGLALATKETAIIVLPAAMAACAVARWTDARQPRQPSPSRELQAAILAGSLAAAAVAALLFSSFLSFPGGLSESLRAIAIYVNRAITPVDHAQPWHYYLGLLAYSSSGGLIWSEGLVLLLAIVGGATAWRPDGTHPERAFWARYLTGYVVFATAIFSATRYKTPWNLLPFYVGAIALAGIGFSSLATTILPRARHVLVAGLALASAQLGWQAWRASVTYASDPRNPYVYAHTVPDLVRLATRIHALAALHVDGARMRVSVIAPPDQQWPLPWYLRAMPHVGYWTTPSDGAALHAPVVVASMTHAARLDGALGDRYVSEFFGLRPDVLLRLYVTRGLSERLIARTTSMTPPRHMPVEHTR
jgi:uncharacterized protein (TIGR03663 family)